LFGQIIIDDKTIEIKRMYVQDKHRRKGQPEAIGLYKKSGYTIIDNYRSYTGSICMEK
jgi:hypothetical protein